MKKMTCEICGAHHLIKANGCFLCETCGTKYSLEEARSLWSGSTDSENEVTLTFVDRQLERMHERKMQKMRLESAERIASIIDDDDTVANPANVPSQIHIFSALKVYVSCIGIIGILTLIVVFLANASA